LIDRQKNLRLLQKYLLLELLKLIEPHLLTNATELPILLKMQCRQALLDFEAGLDRRRITTERERPGGAILNWSKRLRTHWDEHLEFEAMRIHQ
jgi:hypothetical protein